MRESIARGLRHLASRIHPAAPLYVIPTRGGLLSCSRDVAQAVSRSLDVVDEIRGAVGHATSKHGPPKPLHNGTGGYGAELALRRARSILEESRKSHDESWRAILQCEVAEAFNETDPELIRSELLDVAAVCVRWIQSLDSRSKP